jgi:nucleoside-diphosphate-sugar epimerase
MRIFVVGATGYIGSAIARALIERGHTVTGSARSESSAEKLRLAGVEPLTADVSEASTLETPARSSEGAVYAVQYNGANVAQLESAALNAIADALAGSGKPLLYTSGIWIYGNTWPRVADENFPLNPTPLAAHRPHLERIVLDSAGRNVRAIVIRPGVVFGSGGGLPAMWVQSAKENSAARFVGDGANHWPVVHHDDLAELYVLAVEKAAAAGVYNAGDDTSFTVYQMAEAASTGAGRNGATVSWPLEDARRELGAFADALALDSQISSQRARDGLRWRTRETTIVQDLRQGSYAAF